MSSRSGADLNRRKFVTWLYDRSCSHYVDPQLYVCGTLAAQLADGFTTIQPLMPGSTASVVGSVRAFCSWLSVSVDPVPEGIEAVTANHLMRWEQHLANRQRETSSSLPYRQFVHLRALLVHMAKAQPGRMQRSLTTMLDDRVVTILDEMRPENGLPTFSDDEHRSMVMAAYRDVATALALVESADLDALRAKLPRTLAALHVLMCMGTGEPPEVLRQLTLSRIRALTPPPTEDGKPALSHPSDYILTLSKNRSHEMYMHYVVRKDRYSSFALRASVIITQPFRRADGSDALWVDAKGRHAVFGTLAKWLSYHNIPIERPHWARFRKRVVGAEAASDPTGYLAMATRHRPATFYASYVNNPSLRHRAGKVLLDSIEEVFQHATMPIVIPEAPATVASDLEGLGLTAAEAAALLDGSIGGPHAACRDPLSSPFDASGEVCRSSTTGLCFACPNAIITPDHLPALLAIHRIVDPDRAGDLVAWRQTWGSVWTSINDHILPQFDAALVEAAMPLRDDVLVDMGVRQDLAPHAVYL